MVVVPSFDGSLYWMGPGEGGDGEGATDPVAYRLPLNALEVNRPPHPLPSPPTPTPLPPPNAK